MGNTAVVVFARTPCLGRVKTRLVPPLTNRQALALHTACLQATAALVASLPHRIHKFVYFTGSLRTARHHVRTLHLPRTLAVRTQGRGDLGMRLRRMFREFFAAGCDRVVVLGSDSPTLPRARLFHAVTALRRADVVIGPTEDGGYYLLGCRPLARGSRPAALLPDIFKGIPWGTAKTFSRTLARLRHAQAPTPATDEPHSRRLRYRVLPLWYDVDRPVDLIRLGHEIARTHRAYLKPLRMYFAC